mmetsp:Transcript_19474/g.55801  ORF Transcript_19474/g.55801 Transcript_19474/m.55801 type:complete len:169 (+) Transcript_19474:744-1250(+)
MCVSLSAQLSSAQPSNTTQQQQQQQERLCGAICLCSEGVSALVRILPTWGWAGGLAGSISSPMAIQTDRPAVEPRMCLHGGPLFLLPYAPAGYPPVHSSIDSIKHIHTYTHTDTHTYIQLTDSQTHSTHVMYLPSGRTATHRSHSCQSVMLGYKTTTNVSLLCQFPPT